MKEYQKYNRVIFNSFVSWSIHAKSKNHPAMFDLVLPNSNFHELTQTCQKNHNSSINYFYEFEELEIVSLSKNETEAIIRGIILLKLPGNDISYTGKFISVCAKDKIEKDWKLEDIEIEWE